MTNTLQFVIQVYRYTFNAKPDRLIFLNSKYNITRDYSFNKANAVLQTDG